MSTILDALRELGCTASLAGDEPQTATEYADRVTVHTGTRPNWTTAKAKRAELSNTPPDPSPEEKLAAFLRANPDVLAIVTG